MKHLSVAGTVAVVFVAVAFVALVPAQQGGTVQWRTQNLGLPVPVAPAPAAIPPLQRATTRPAIMLTGYWPPSNEAVRRFSPNAVQNPLGWVGSDWENRGYDVYAYFPEFTPPTCTSCGRGSGDLEVDYQDTVADFWALADAIDPIAIVTTSRSSTAVNWELEMNQFNRTTWSPDYTAPTQPTPSPPDATVPAGHLRPSKLPVQNIVNAILAAGVLVNPNICFTGNGGGFLSEFVAYLGVWYQDIHRSPTDPAWCATAGHVHIGHGLPWPVATQALEITLRQVILHVDAVRAGTICQTDLGFQGPGLGALQCCGQPLNLVGNTADLRFSGGLPSGIAVVGIGVTANPTPLFGGLAVPTPLADAFFVVLDGNGEWLWRGLPGGPVGLPSVFVQAAHYDPALPQGWGLSNALDLAFL